MKAFIKKAYTEFKYPCTLSVFCADFLTLSAQFDTIFQN